MIKKLKSIAGVTLVELLIGIVVSSIMMFALFTSYNAINNSYSQVSDRVEISRTGRLALGMLLKDIRMAGYFDINSIKHGDNQLQPILVYKGGNFNKASRRCDSIAIVYGDTILNEDGTFDYPIYRTLYQCVKSKTQDTKQGKGSGNYVTKDLFAITVTKVKYKPNSDPLKAGTWEDPTTDGDPATFPAEVLIDHVEDMIFNAIDENGKIISPPPNITNENKDKIYSIRSVDIAIMLRSTDEFFKEKRERNTFALSNSDRNKEKTDRYLRDTIVVTAHNRNIGMLR